MRLCISRSSFENSRSKWS